MEGLRRCIAGPGLFRVLLAGVVILNHSLPIHFGPGAVYIFFMLSGYWVYVMWHKEYADARQPYVTFVVSRIWRLLPVYYTALLIFLCTDHVFPTFMSMRRLPGGWSRVHLLFSHFFILGYASLPFAQKLVLPVWSLDIELQFYLVAPLLLMLLHGSRKWPLLRLVPYAVAVLGLADFFWHYATIDLQSAGWLPMYLVFFLIGMETAHCNWRPSPWLAFSSLMATLGMIALCGLLPILRSLFFGQNVGWLASYNPHGNFVLACLCAPYAMATLRTVPSRESRIGKADRDLGNITYEFYLLHWPVLSVMVHFIGSRPHTAKQLPCLIVAWVLLVPIAWAVYRFIDKPMDALRRSFVMARRNKVSGDRRAEVVADPSGP